MKTKILLLCSFLFLSFIRAEEKITVQALDSDISENLDLSAVANLFGRVNDMEEFEKKLNSSETQLSNLDLNGDGTVDYLRVVESTKENVKYILIQAVLAQDIFQDVATILVERSKENNTMVQVIGDAYLYGENYVIEPVYIRTPLIYSYFWSSYYRPWYSPFYWEYYPAYYHYPLCVQLYDYRRFIYEHNRAYHCSFRHRRTANQAYHNVRPAESRNDYAIRNPEHSFSRRQSDSNIRNTRELQNSRGSRTVTTRATTTELSEKNYTTRGNSQRTGYEGRGTSTRTGRAVSSSGESSNRSSGSGFSSGSSRSSSGSYSSSPSNSTSSRSSSSPAITNSSRSSSSSVNNNTSSSRSSSSESFRSGGSSSSRSGSTGSSSGSESGRGSSSRR